MRGMGRRNARNARGRLGFAIGLTLLVLISLGFVGGLGYASSGFKHAVTAFARIAHVQKPQSARRPASAGSAAASQYGGPQTPPAPSTHKIARNLAALQN